MRKFSKLLAVVLAIAVIACPLLNTIAPMAADATNDFGVAITDGKAVITVTPDNSFSAALVKLALEGYSVDLDTDAGEVKYDYTTAANTTETDVAANASVKDGVVTVIIAGRDYSDNDITSATIRVPLSGSGNKVTLTHIQAVSKGDVSTAKTEDFIDIAYADENQAGLINASAAAEAGYTVEALGHTHDFTGGWVSDANGHWHVCQAEGCSAPAATDEVIAHTSVSADNAVAATCTTAGKEADTVCSVCGYVITTGAVINATGHGELTYTYNGDETHDATCTVCDQVVTDNAACSYNDGVITTAPSCTAEGVKTFTCSLCGGTKTEAVDKAAHTPATAVEENRKEATCTAAGSYDSVVYCSVCNEELSRETITIPVTDHKAAEAIVENEVKGTCTVAGSYESVIKCSECGTEISRETVNTGKVEDNHTNLVTLEAKDATCTDSGLTQGQQCEDCGVTTVQQQVVDKLAHTEVYTNNGDNHTVSCSVCSQTLRTEDHTFTNGACVCGATEVNEKITITPNIYIQAEIGFTFLLTRDQLSAYDNYELVIDHEYYDGSYMIKNAETLVVPKANVLNNTKKNPYYILTGVGMYELDLNFTAYIKCYKNGKYVAKSNAISTTLATALKSNYSTSTVVSYKNLVADLLNMSAAAQTYFGNLNKESNLYGRTLVNADDPKYNFVASEYASKTVGDLEVITNPTTPAANPPVSTSTYPLINSLIYGKSVGVTWLIQDKKKALDISKLEMSITYTSLYPAGDVTDEVSGETTEVGVRGKWKRSGNYIQYSFDGVYLYDTNKIVTATITYDDQPLYTNTYTVDTYCNSQLAASGDIAVLADTTAKFGNTAREYFTIQNGGSQV